MKNKYFILILILTVVLSISIFCGCTDDRAYLIEGRYYCENLTFRNDAIDRITVNLEDISDIDYDRYDPHIIQYSEKAFYLDLSIWKDGEKKEIDYVAYYESKLNYFTIEFNYDWEIITIDFVTESDEQNNYYLKANLQIYSQPVELQEIILKIDK